MRFHGGLVSALENVCTENSIKCCIDFHATLKVPFQPPLKVMLKVTVGKSAIGCVLRCKDDEKQQYSHFDASERDDSPIGWNFLTIFMFLQQIS